MRALETELEAQAVEPPHTGPAEAGERGVSLAGHRPSAVTFLYAEAAAVHMDRVENGRPVSGEPRPPFFGTVLPALNGAADLDGSERISPPVVAAPFRLKHRRIG
ncbi:hypothetical protein [Roseococcus sp. YIM B11640]|uniref:hypothetical protein n=1 Tax=Roseococcus sp. YIM B11640 TaxID=3133973 RepID=UPI003C7A0BC0